MSRYHDITKIDLWFIDKLAILVEMEDALKAVGAGERSLTAELLAEAKRNRVPGQCNCKAYGNLPGGYQKLRYDNGIRAVYKMVDTCAAEFAAETPIIIHASEVLTRLSRPPGEGRCLFWVPAQSVLDRELNLTSVLSTVPGHSAGKAMRPLL